MLFRSYLEEFVQFWSAQPQIRKIWFSMFTPQIGDEMPEILTKEERRRAVADIAEIRKKYPKLEMPEALLKQFLNPPHSPEECVFAKTTQTFSADLRSAITPCQFGGTPDCEQCGCIASMVLAAVADHKLAGFVPVGAIFKASVAWGQTFGSPIPPLPAKPALVEIKAAASAGD